MIGRDLGLVLQPPKGTGTGSNVLSLNQPVVGTTSNITEPSVSTYIQGNLTINDSSQFIVGRQIDNQMYIGGNLQGVGSLVIPPTTNYIPTTTPVPNSSVFSQATSDLVIRVVGHPFPPAITSANSATFKVGTAGNFTVTTTGLPTPALSETPTTLPTGVTFVDNHDGTATLASTAATPAGTTTLTITANNGVTPNATQSFTLIVAAAAAPTVTGLNPSSGPAIGGTQVTINGTNLTGATVVDFGTTPATNFTVVNDNSITATSPAGTGTVNVTVVTPGGQSTISSLNQFTYT